MDYLEVAEALRILGLCRPDSLQKVSREHTLSFKMFFQQLECHPLSSQGDGTAHSTEPQQDIS